MWIGSIFEADISEGLPGLLRFKTIAMALAREGPRGPLVLRKDLPK